MNGSPTDHEGINARLDDFLDGELTVSERREVEAHLESCAACRADETARRELLAEADALPRSIEPGRDLWPDIRTRLGGRERAGNRRSAPHLSFPSRSVLAAAAIVLLLAGGAAIALWLSTAGGPGGSARIADRGDGPGRADGRDPVALLSDWRALEGEYVGAAEELQETLDEIGDQLSPETRRIVEENLRVIDDAIAESRSALERDPANRELERALRSAWTSKVEMLQYVTKL